MNTKKRCVIKIGNFQELSRMVQEFLFSKGYNWGGHIPSKEFNPYVVKDYGNNASIFVGLAETY